jgi:putative ABC transport system permease protein
MRLTGDNYFDEANLMDIKVISTLGITDDDIETYASLSDIETAEGAYSADFLTEFEGDQTALRVLSISENMNEITVTDGRLPEKASECLADDESDYKVGDVIKLESGSDDEVEDTLSTSELTVVGTGSSPCYISFNRGSTTIGTGGLTCFLYVPAETFVLDVYTEAYLTVKGAKELTAYTDEYEDRIDEAMEVVESLAGERGVIRKRDLVDDATATLDEAKADLDSGEKKANKKIKKAEKKIADGKAELADAKQQVSDGWDEIEDAEKEIKEKEKELEASQKELKDAETEYNEGLAKYEEGKKKYEEAKKSFEDGEADAEKQINEGKAGLTQLETAISEAKAGYELTQDPTLAAQIEALQSQYDTAKAQVDAAEKQLSDAKKELKKTKKTLDSTEKQLADAKKQIDSGKKQLASGKKQIADAKTEIATQKKKLNDAEAEIEENEKELSDAEDELAEAKEKADKEIADGKAEIADAQEEIDDIPDADVYIYDRSTLPEYTGYGENADRMRAIGRVFPVLFFLVAALISLTSMTRMVEEQRVQIGTMKALGYSKAKIAAKYIGYALSASVIGSVIGALIGEKIFPYIIIYAYGIMYHHMSPILVPYVLSYALSASAVAVACTLLATIFSCYRELGAQAAVLMRPPAPKKGKRVLLERVPFIWRRLNFSWKSSVRNLMRYKKRFFMTIFGIGGCMALMVVGYGIQDSVYEIADVQYTEIQTYDGQIILQDDLDDGDRQALQSFLESDSDLDRFTDAYMKNLTLKTTKAERQTYVVVMSDVDSVGDYVDFHDRKTKESYTLDDTGVIISEKTAKLLGAGVGDTLVVESEEDGNHEVVISNICENYLGHYIYMTPTYYRAVFEKEPVYNCVLFATQPSYSEEQIEEAGTKIMKRDEVLSISYMNDVKEQLDDMLKSLNLVIVVLIISAGMLAFVVLYNLNTINITERQRELATLKVLGFYDPEVAIYVFRENIMLTFLGAAAGVILGKVLTLFIIETVEVDAAMFGRVINISSFVYSLLFTIAFSIIINGIMYFKLKKIDMVESLKSIE